MVWRVRGRPLNSPASFIHPCQPTVATQPPKGPGWAHELKADGYRLQIHVRGGRVRLYTMNGADWSKRYPLILKGAAKVKGSAIMDAEVVWLDSEGIPNFDALHSRLNDARVTALAFDLLMFDGEDFRRKSYLERKAALRKLLRGDRGIQYVEHAEGHGDKLYAAACSLGLEGIVSRNSMRLIAQANRRRGSRSRIRTRRLQLGRLTERSETTTALVQR